MVSDDHHASGMATGPPPQPGLGPGPARGFRVTGTSRVGGPSHESWPDRAGPGLEPQDRTRNRDTPRPATRTRLSPPESDRGSLAR